MAISLKAGTRIFSAVDSTELIAVKAPAEPVELTLGGHPAVLSAAERAEGTALGGHDGGVAMGKRYVNAAGDLEVLVTKAGPSVPALGGVPLELKDAKPLPASD